MLILRILLFDFILLLNNYVQSEWIELPQFSDDSKIYRLPFNKHDRQKIMLNSAVNEYKHELFNSTDIYDYRRLKGTMVMQGTVKTAFIVADPLINISVTTEKPKIHHDEYSDNFNSVQSVAIEKLNERQQYLSNISTASHTNSNNSKSTSKKIPLTKSQQKDGLFFMNSLPIELINRVHKTFLTIRKATVAAKMRFLENFKTTILRKLSKILINRKFND